MTLCRCCSHWAIIICTTKRITVNVGITGLWKPSHNHQLLIPLSRKLYIETYVIIIIIIIIIIINSSCAYWCTVHIPAGVQSIWLMFLSQLQSTISDQACVPHLPATTFFLVFNQDWASGHFPMPGHLRGTVCQLTFRTYLTPQLSRNV